MTKQATSRYSNAVEMYLVGYYETDLGMSYWNARDAALAKVKARRKEITSCRNKGVSALECAKSIAT